MTSRPATRAAVRCITWAFACPTCAAHGRRMQAAGLTSPGGLREQVGWRYVMVEAPDGVLVEFFEFDDPDSVINRDG